MTDASLVAIPANEYHRDDRFAAPTLSSSIANILVGKSPAHAHAAHPRLGGESFTPTDDMDKGTAAHTLILGEGTPIVEVNADSWRTKAAKEARADARGGHRVAILSRHLDGLRKAADAIKAELARRNIVLDGVSERGAFWKSRTFDFREVQCRALIDHWQEDTLTVTDLKTSHSADPDKIQRSIGDRGYDLQRAAYVEAIEALNPDHRGRVKFRWIYCELSPPYAVTVAEPAGSYRVRGEKRWRKAVETWAHCLESGHWPQYSEDVVRVEAPPWLMRDEMLGGYADDEGEAA